MKILVIDDEKPTLSMFKLFLSAYGYHVFVAESGEEGLELYEQELPEIVFTDLKMPGLDGLEVLKRIRQKIDRSGTATEITKEKCAPTPVGRTQVIIITGHGDMDKAMEALDLDASDFINKPVEKKALDAALKRAELRIAAEGMDQSPHTLTWDKEGSKLTLNIAGKLTSTPHAEQVLTEWQTPDHLSAIHTLSINFHPSFSIDRKGIFLLMNFMASVRNLDISITMKGLSYNTIQFFKMAGLHESATLIQDPVDE